MLRLIKQRFSNRPDSEHEQAALRLAITFIIATFLIFNVSHAQGFFFAAILIYSSVAIGIFSLIIVKPAPSASRRLVGNVADVIITSYLMIHGDLATAPMLFIYLFITIGNGFRFGNRYLDISLGLSLLGLSVVIYATPFWQKHISLGIGVMIGTAVISFYARMLISRLYGALKKAEIANFAKRSFLSNVSHEMRTPLNAIIGMADLLGDTTLNQDQRNMLRSISVASRSLLRQVQDVLDFSKIEAGKVTIEKVEFDIYEMMANQVSMLEGLAKSKQIGLSQSISPKIRPYIQGDVYHLEQVLTNLIGNAIKFTEAGQVQVELTLLDETAETQTLRFSVKDTGIGIPPEALERIFDSFTQADDSTTRRFGGTGLGTTIAKELVTLMGGTMAVTSELGKGSHFWFDLTVEARQSKGDNALLEMANEVRLLLLGFDEGQHEAFVAQLGAFSAKTATCATVDEAMNMMAVAATQAQPFTTMFVWADQPRAQLLDIATALHRVRANMNLPLVLYASRHIPSNEALFLSVGYTNILQAPVEPTMVHNILHASAVQHAPEPSNESIRQYYCRHGGPLGLNILVAEDNVVNQKVVQRILELVDCSVTMVEDGERALDVAEQEKFDLIILDMNMPKLGGIDVARALRTLQLGQKGPPLIMLSANATADVLDEAREAGIDLFLAKPIEARRLLEAMIQLLPPKKEPDAARDIKANGPALTTTRPVVRKRLPWVGQPTRFDTSMHRVINHEQLEELKAISKNNRFLSELIVGFLQDNQQLIEKMTECLEQEKYELFKDLAHAMKGASSNLGAEQLVAICSRIGNTSHAELARSGKPLLHQLREVAALVRLHLAEYLQTGLGE